jgi:5-methylcytosine-specific restriction endonuclease McrA
MIQSKETGEALNVMFPKPKTVKLSPVEKAMKAWGKRKTARILTKGMKVIEKELKQAKYPRVVPKVKRKKVKRVKLPSTRKLIRECDRLFSLFIRQRDKSCVLCGSTTNLTNGHLIKRGKKSVRWDEMNCNCLCMGCNYKDNFDHDVYVQWWILKYGVGAYFNLIERSRGILKPSREFLSNIITKYNV